MPRLASKLTVLAALVVLTLPACSSDKSTKPSPGTLPTATASPTGPASPATTPTTSAPATSPATAMTPTTPATTTASGAPSGAAVAGTQITISKFLYSPVNLQVKPGATVTVVNQDSVAHTVTAESGSGGAAFDTGTINGNASGTFTAPTTPGTYRYICIFHSQMHGILTVSS